MPALPADRHQNDWTETQIALLRKLALEHLSARTIAAQFPGKTRNAVLGKAFRLRIQINGRLRIDGHPNGRFYDSFWNHDGNLEKLKALYFSPMGYSNYEIAAELGCGLSTLRRGLAKMRVAEGPLKPREVVYRGPGKNGVKKPFIVQKRRPRTAGERAKARAAHQPSVPELGEAGITGALTLMELNGHTCRWPVHGQGWDMLYCGAEPIPGVPYCGIHCRRAYAS